ncbi:ran-binding protein 3-like [Amia ocellicauda]|uniref:ran-binding protein 3-like n=1 Tax=Amia ocellicauda TaxID=2972642 RepID=UPI003464CADC
MRGHQLSPCRNAAQYPARVPVSPDASADAPRQAPSNKCGEAPSQTRTFALSSGKSSPIKQPYGGLQGTRRPDRAPSVTQEKPVISPPVFIFQKTALHMKRVAEDSVDDNGLGVSPGKRMRSFTFPSPNACCKAGFKERRKRTQSTSFSCAFSFPPSQTVSRKNVFMPSSLCNININKPILRGCPLWKAKGAVLRPATLQAPLPQSFSPPLPAEASNSQDTAHTPGTNHTPGQQLPRDPHSLPAEDPSSIEMDSTPSYNSALHLTSSSADRKPLKTHPLPPKNSFQFVFGENMSERVLSPVKTPDAESADCSDAETSDLESSSYSESEFESSTSGSLHKTVRRRTLRESAAAYTAACGRRCLLKQVQVFTGEEQESNVLQMTCKLFVFEKASQSWCERGRGVLRLNDLDTEQAASLQSRLVMRNQGSLKVILNTKLWAEMRLHRATRKNLQLTATDLEDGSVRVFLIQASVKEITRLYLAIHHRLVALRCRAVEQGSGPGLEAEEPGPAFPHFDSEGEGDEAQVLTRLGCSRTGGSDWSNNYPRMCS